MFDLENFLPYRLIRAGQAASNAVAEEYASKFGLTVSQWRVLAHLSRKPGISINELCHNAGLDRVSTSRACTALESDGWVSKQADAKDKRLLVINLTDSGKQRFQELSKVALNAERHLLANVSEADLERLYAILIVIEKNASR